MVKRDGGGVAGGGGSEPGVGGGISSSLEALNYTIHLPNSILQRPCAGRPSLLLLLLALQSGDFSLRRDGARCRGVLRGCRPGGGSHARPPEQIADGLPAVEVCDLPLPWSSPALRKPLFRTQQFSFASVLMFFLFVCFLLDWILYHIT